MKKILCMLLACVLCVSTLGGCQGEQKEPWTLEDFSVYDEDGNLVEELPTDTSFKDEQYTKRGICRGDPISKLLELYPLEGSGYKLNDQETYTKWNGKCKDGAELLEKAKDDTEANYLIMVFFKKEGDKLIPLEIDENGRVQLEGEMTYSITFGIALGSIGVIRVENEIR